MYTVITENDVSDWSDETGILYHFPKRYCRLLAPGTQLIYYKGRERKEHKGKVQRLSSEPHYFGSAKIGKLYPDRHSEKGDYFATIVEYQPFTTPVNFKQNNKYIEIIPDNKKTNYWRDGVRAIDKLVFDRIVSMASISFNDNAEVVAEEEGTYLTSLTTRYERNPRLRKQAIAIHGAVCKACGFDAKKVYGDAYDGMIHIHHLNPLSEVATRHSVDPEVDLIPLCPNCHAVVHHKKNKLLSLEELKKLIQEGCR